MHVPQVVYFPSGASSVHKSYLVSLDKIDAIERDRVTIRDVVIPISENLPRSVPCADWTAAIVTCVTETYAAGPGVR